MFDIVLHFGTDIYGSFGGPKINVQKRYSKRSSTVIAVPLPQMSRYRRSWDDRRSLAPLLRCIRPSTAPWRMQRSSKHRCAGEDFGTLLVHAGGRWKLWRERALDWRHVFLFCAGGHMPHEVRKYEEVD